MMNQLNITKTVAGIAIVLILLGFYNLDFISKTWSHANRTDTLQTGAFIMGLGLLLAISILVLPKSSNKYKPVDENAQDIMDKISMLNDMYKNGLLNKEEYKQKRIVLLDQYKNNI